jgi:outer membrane protein
MRKLVLCCIFLPVYLLTFSAKAQNTSKWDLRRCIEYAMSNNISVRQADVQARISAITLKQSKLQQIPSLNFSGNHGFSFGRSLDRSTNVYTDRSLMYQNLNLQAQVNIFNWNNQKNTIASNDYTYQADLASVDKVKNDIGLNVARQYLLILLDIEQVKVNDIQLSQSKAQLDNTRKQVNAGALPELNAAELEAQVARDSATFVSSQTTVELDKLALKALLSLPADLAFELETPPVEQIPIDNIMEITPGVVFDMAMKTQPQIKANNLRYLASQKSMLAARGRLYPTISAFAGLSTNYNSFFKVQDPFNTPLTGYQDSKGYALDGVTQYPVFFPQYQINYQSQSFGNLWSGYWRGLKDNFGQGIGIGLSVPIFNGWSAKANVEKAKMDIRNRELAVEQDTLQLKEDVYTAYNQALGSYQTFLARQIGVATAERSFDLATKRYDIGSMQTIEWLTNQTNLYNARVNLLIAQFDYVFKMKVLEYYKGQGLRL